MSVERRESFMRTAPTESGEAMVSVLAFGNGYWWLTFRQGAMLADLRTSREGVEAMRDACNAALATWDEGEATDGQ